MCSNWKSSKGGPSAISSGRSANDSAGKGWLPPRVRYATTPSANTSSFWICSRARRWAFSSMTVMAFRTSGAMYRNVPSGVMATGDATTMSSMPRGASWPKNLANPKSTILIDNVTGSVMMFSGLMSRWTISFSCRYASTSRSCDTMRRASLSVRHPPWATWSFSTSRSSPPLTYSRHKHTRSISGSSKTSYNLMQLGWLMWYKIITS
mmetsp:Transcript_40541/g.67765  ORF Transcript_40541/g.67765 Transcript_40541/m.67765 type:complete len:208 (+) Transcript_40541:130-753(+)